MNSPFQLQKLEGSKCRGQLLIFGATNWDLIGRKEVPKQQGERGARLRSLCAAPKLAQSSPKAIFSAVRPHLSPFFPPSCISEPGPESVGATQVWVSLRDSGAERGFGTVRGSQPPHHRRGQALELG